MANDERAVKRGTGELAGFNLEEASYEGYAAVTKRFVPGLV